MLSLPFYITGVFIVTTLLTLAFFISAVKQSAYHKMTTIILLILLAWLGVQMLIALSGFYTTNMTSIPPRFLLAFMPALLTIIALFVTEKGRKFVDSLPLLTLTYLNVVRIPVELCLYWLFLYKTVPELMTFSGRNFDILAGITAPFIAYFGMQRQMLGKKGLLLWHVVSLALLLFIIFNGVLSAPLFFQQFAFDQPNIALLHFPFVWLPAFIVPVVLFGHFTAIRRLH